MLPECCNVPSVMARSNVKHVLIANTTLRRTTFRKRKAGLLRKLSELTTLCGVVACAIIFSAYDRRPEVWPSVSEAFQVLEKFRGLPLEMQGKHMMDQDSFLRTNITKLNEKVERKRKKNRKAELELVFVLFISDSNSHILNSLKNMNDASRMLDEKIRSIVLRIERAKNEVNE